MSRCDKKNNSTDWNQAWLQGSAAK